ncbi:techylectin-5A-like [Macrobrachium rosenbergii]|uniref:techylectin-5A-like n=1 Tax=Macrobrachium rosenbergii TaxID=79674 RepID=UPI0034D50639
MFMTQWKTPLVVTVVFILNFKKVSAFPKSQILWFDVGPQIRNCRDVQRQGNTTSGIYLIFPYKCCPDVPLQVFCDMETDGGGWTVIQRRADIEPREDFYRTWMEYALGFGNLKGEFWLGNDNIHALTDQTLNEIRFDLADFKDNTRWAKYKFFYLHDRSSSYKLEVVEYSGDAGDSFTTHSGAQFSAKDIDNDAHPPESCSVMYKGAWWYKACHASNLNGQYLSGNHTSYADGVNWFAWLGHHYSLKKTEMKIRPAY